MSSLERNNYFEGKVLTADDLRLEQDYFLEKHRRHNRLFHGCGVLSGLSISLSGNVIDVEPGIALDCAGNEVILSESAKLKLPREGHDLYLTIKYSESKVAPVPVPSGEEYSRIKEQPVLGLERSDPWHKHIGDKSGWLPCGQPHSISLAKLNFEEGRWKKIRIQDR